VKIAIVGAGPAGCHLAHLLAESEHDILLFDDRAPYEKACGGGLSPLVGQRFPDVLALPFSRHRPRRVRLRASDSSQVERTFDFLDWAIVSRAEFGRALLERALANGRVRHVRQRVTTLGKARDGWTLHTAGAETFSADFLVGADGVRSVVRREVLGPISRQHLALAVGYRVREAPDAIVFQTYADLEGYLWPFPRADLASVGIGTRLGAVPPWDLWHRVDRFLEEMCPGAERVRRWAGLLPMARDAGLWDTPCAEPGWALLGDAAGHVHPLTGEGITYALWSAELLAEAIGQGDPQVYEVLWREEFGDQLQATGALVSATGLVEGGYEAVYQMAMVTALGLH